MRRRLARFNRRVTNRFARPIARWAPPLAPIHHTGRRTGRRTGPPYATPVLLFRNRDRVCDRYIVPLPYGPETDQDRKVLQAGRCVVEMRGKSHVMTPVEVLHATPDVFSLPRIARRTKRGRHPRHAPAPDIRPGVTPVRVGADHP